MAHEIEQFDDGTASFFSAKKPAWHKLGIVTPDALTAEEALLSAQLDWTVELHPVYAHIPNVFPDLPPGLIMPHNALLCPDQFATVRIGTKDGTKVLSVVGKRYVPIQNVDSFAILNDIVAESGAHFDTAGSLFGGKRVFVTMKMPEHITIGDGTDDIDLYLLAMNSHDGSSAFTLATVLNRVVCNNTLRLALQNAKSTIHIRHTVSAKERIQQARDALGISFAYVDAFQAEIDKLVNREYTDAQFYSLVDQLIPTMPNETDLQKQRTANGKAILTNLWTAPTQQNVAGTAWAALNAAVEYSDYHSPVRAVDKDMARATRVMTGTTDDFKQKAYELVAA